MIVFPRVGRDVLLQHAKMLAQHVHLRIRVDDDVAEKFPFFLQTKIESVRGGASAGFAVQIVLAPCERRWR